MHMLFLLWLTGCSAPSFVAGLITVVSLDLPTASGFRLSPGHPGVQAAPAFSGSRVRPLARVGKR